MDSEGLKLRLKEKKDLAMKRLVTSGERTGAKMPSKGRSLV